MVRIIPEEAIREHLRLADSIAALETLHEEFAAGRAATTFMETIESAPANPPAEATKPALHQLTTMAGVTEAFGVGAVRINSDISHWPIRKGGRVKERISDADGQYNGVIALFSTNTSDLLALFPFAVVSAHRVAGSSVLGSKYFANEDARTLAVLGSGWQATWHVQAYDALFDLDVIKVFSPTHDHRTDFVARLDERVSADVVVVDTPQEAMAGADIVQCATNSSGPVFELDWLEPGMHVSIISHQEAPKGFFTSDALDAFGTNFPGVVQHRLHGTEYSQQEFYQNTWNTYVTETAHPVPRLEYYRKASEPADWGKSAVTLAQLVGGETVARTNADDITGFFVAGVPADLSAVGSVLYDIAEELDLGVTLDSSLLKQQNR
ncbi:hypothetical protein [Haladaptatus sp. DJG-WS-42]|uniref:hypothetical protein n=1 Tax=Haladaptatus sp. DJG-WS-42 TaxID=3120516 RepID=UPI0030D54C5D